MFKHGDYFYLFVSKGSCCCHDRNRPAPSKGIGSPSVGLPLLPATSSTRVASFVWKAGMRWCLRVIIGFTDQASRAWMTTQS